MTERVEPMASPWPLRMALGTLLFAVPLFAFGGIVTTIGAGMAVEGWLNAEGHFMPFFPIDKWLRDFATFVEHTHRQIGMIVGFFAIGGVVASHRCGAPRSARALSWVALAIVCFQGYLGGQRVELVSRDLAFVHGGVAQLAFALLALHVLVQSRRWRELHAARPKLETGLPTTQALGAALVVYGQIWIGAWYRHGLRGTGGDVTSRLHLHLGFAAVATLAVVLLVRGLRLLAREEASGSVGQVAGGEARRLEVLLTLQLLLGVAAWLGRGETGVTVLEIAAAVGHVIVGASLLASCTLSLAWCLRWRRVAAPLQTGAPVLPGRTSP